MSEIFLPKDYEWVDLSNYQFKSALDNLINEDDNLFIQAKAGCGKSLMINIAAAMKENIVILSTTGTTAMQLSSDGIPAKTIHSFFQFPAVPLFTEKDIYNLFA